MSEKPEYVQLEKGDDANIVRDRLSFLRGKRVLLIWPEEGTALTRKLDLVLIQREAMRRAIRLALVTHDAEVVKHATELNISTFETIGASERGRWKRGRAKIFLGRDARPVEELPREELSSAVKEDAAEKPPPRPRSRRAEPTTDDAPPRRSGGAGRLVALLILLLILAGGAAVALPTATVTITPGSETISLDMQVIADPNAASVIVENSIVPAVRVQITIEETGTVETTGVQDAENVLSTGSVVFINQTDAEVLIPAGTTVSTSTGTPILFQTTAEATMPSGVGQQMEVPIQALASAAGSAGNVDRGLINTVIGELADDLTVRNLNPTSGGASSAVRVVSVEDQERLLGIVRQQLQARAYTEMLSQLSESQSIILETIRIGEETAAEYSAAAGDVADNLSLSVTAVVEAVAVEERYDRQIAVAGLNARIPRGRALRADTVAVTRGAVQDVDADGRVYYSISASGLVVGQVNVALLQERLIWMNTESAVRYLNAEVDLDDNTPPQIALTPDWYPVLPLRIEIVVNQP